SGAAPAHRAPPGAALTGAARPAAARSERSAPPPPRSAPEPAAASELAREVPAAAPARGFLVVNSIPRAAIVVDGSAVGGPPSVRHRIASGRHRVTARFGDGRHDDRVIDVSAGEVYLMFDGR